MVIAVAVATFLFTELVREPHMTDRNRLEILAVLTGLLWPVMVVGLLELVLLVVIRSMLRLRDPMVVPGRLGSASRSSSGAGVRSRKIGVLALHYRPMPRQCAARRRAP